MIIEIDQYSLTSKLGMEDKMREREGMLNQPVYDVNSLLKVVPIGRSSIYNEIKAGRLRTSKMGRRTLFLANDVLAWLEQMQIGS